MEKNFDKNLYEILEKKYKKSLENFVPEFRNLKHIKANEMIGKINEIRKKKRISRVNYTKLSSLMSNFLFCVD